jgi:arylsulfatase A-like enzyme
MKLGIITLTCLCCCATAANSPAAAPPRPNIIVFLVDDMGIMDTSVPFLTDKEGRPRRYPLNDYYRTPSLERLAARGVRFNDFAAMTVCSPTRVSIMTGQNAARHRTTNWIRPEKNNRGAAGPPDWNWWGLKTSDVTLPRLLAANGYRTIHVGKGHFGSRRSAGANPKNLGFEVNIAGGAIGHPRHYLGNYGVPGLNDYAGPGIFLTEALTRAAKDQVAEAVKAGRPFYLYLAHYAVHGRFESDPRFADHYKASGKSPAAQAFATMIEGVDKSLGDIVQQLDELGVAENTLVIFLGDNGTDAPLGGELAVACAAPLRGKKGTCYEGGTRVPFVAAWAKANPANPHQARLPIPAGAVQRQLASVCDIFPTVLDLLDIAVPKGHVVDGFPLTTLLAGKRDGSRPGEFLMHYPHESRSTYFTVYRRGDWKVIYHYFPSKESGDSRYELFNLAEDPFEATDLAGKRPEQLRTMMEGLIGGLEKQKALYPVKDGQPQCPLLPKVDP